MVIVRAITLRVSIVLILCVVNLTACCTVANLTVCRSTGASHEAENQVASSVIPNFREVDPGIYRGSQPKTPEDWAYLQSKHIKTIIKLDLESEGSDDEAVRLGLMVVDASGPPSNITDFWEAPKPERIRLAIQTLENESLRPIYVHCLHGHDRTGLVVGLFRVLHDHYTKLEAFNEMCENNFHWQFPGLFEVWKNFDGKTLP
ncbi:MAG: tyrosine-protein phosphatase [Smithella sp.]|jgi:protein tyrosine/serine phosphatase